MRKFVKQTMSDSAQWEAYNTKVMRKMYALGGFNLDGSPRTVTLDIPIKSLVKGCGKQRYKELKLRYKGAK